MDTLIVLEVAVKNNFAIRINHSGMRKSMVVFNQLLPEILLTNKSFLFLYGFYYNFDLKKIYYLFIVLEYFR